MFIYICGNCKANKQPHERVSTGEATDRICPSCGEWSMFYYEKKKGISPEQLERVKKILTEQKEKENKKNG